MTVPHSDTDSALIALTGKGAAQCTIAEVGGKALPLAQLAALGLPVPAAVCVPTSVYESCIRALADSDAQLAAWIAGSATPSVAPELAPLRLAISHCPIPEALRTAVSQFLHDQVGTPQAVAVRSSGTAEDLPQESFAGLHDTYLDVVGVDDVLDAVRHCWASMWSDRAFAYRRDRQVDHLALGMAVIIQQMVPADAAGVAFTADPITADPHFVVIESCHGLGEALVSGRVTPDRYRALKGSGRVINVEAADPGAASSTTGSLTMEQATRVARLAERVESLRTVNGNCVPQDIEWALAGDDLYLLQARPITTLPQRSDVGPLQVWSNLNAGEVLPDVVTPATEGMLRFVDRLIRRIVQRVGLELDDLPLIGVLGGRAYFNANTLVGLLEAWPLGGRIDLQAILGGENAGAGAGELPFQLRKEQVAPVRGGWLRFLRRLPGLALWLWRLQPKRAAVLVSQLADRRLQMRRDSWCQLETAQQVERVVAQFARLLDDDALAAAGVGAAYFDLLGQLCQRWFPGEAHLQANALLAGKGSVSSAEAGLALWQLAATAAKSAQVRSALESADSFAAAVATLPGLDGGPEFLQQWSAFCDEHGHHARGEIELATPRWSDQPDYLLHAVNSYLGMIPGKDLAAEYEARRVRAESGATEIRGRVWFPKRWLFNFVLRNAERGCQLRENLKSEVIRHVALGRERLLAIGEGLATIGALARAEDVFQLYFEELQWAIREPALARERVAERLGKDAEYRRSAPLSTIYGEWSPALTTTPTAMPEGNEWRGIAVSPGVVTGRARVIRGVTHEDRVLEGEILVAPYTDPGWTPYFLPAAGIVVDMGGLLSHGSIVAREYGIPAVVNVGPASERLQTGALLRVDGDAGIVTILADD